MSKITDLLSYYSKIPDPLLLRKANDLMGHLSESEQDRVIDWCLEHLGKKQGLDIPGLRMAMAECGVSVSAPDETPREWVCDLCGWSFLRVTISTPTLRKQGVHDYCPRCGLAPSDTDTAFAYMRMLNGRMPDWYKRLKDELRKYHLEPGTKPRYDPKADEEDEARRKADLVERMKREAQEEVQRLVSSKEVVGAR